MRRKVITLVVIVAVSVAGLFLTRYKTIPHATLDTPIGDLTVSAKEILKQSPEVVKIEVLLKAPTPSHRVIHIADRHYASREQFRNFQRHRTDEGYTEYVQETEKLQAAQCRLLRMLVDRHTLRQVFAEGHSTDSPNLCARGIEWLRRAHSMGDGSELRERLRTAIDEADAKGEDSTGLRKQERLLEEAHGFRLSLGAAYELAVARPCVDILPAEDRVAYEAAFEAAFEARKFRSGYAAANEAREDAIVRNLLQVPCAVIILGGAHDLSRSIKRLGGGRCDYLKVSVTAYSPPPSNVLRSLVAREPHPNDNDTVAQISRGPFADRQTALVSLALAIFFLIVVSWMFPRDVPEDEEAS